MRVYSNLRAAQGVLCNGASERFDVCHISKVALTTNVYEHRIFVTQGAKVTFLLDLRSFKAKQRI